jgi:hypothetical protein
MLQKGNHGSALAQRCMVVYGADIIPSMEHARCCRNSWAETALRGPRERVSSRNGSGIRMHRVCSISYAADPVLPVFTAPLGRQIQYAAEPSVKNDCQGSCHVVNTPTHLSLSALRSCRIVLKTPSVLERLLLTPHSSFVKEADAAFSLRSSSASKLVLACAFFSRST